ncbi:DUF3291 domain-containing protein [uncultured Eudoraea sp.]|uniref:DUF3291 domain-containing protein n=1 Tax=uncultured Eudoraea sp. TaxID=1035614 RepID=UPI002616F8F2|nr:DUF3291 domain-containing protein [uncultured Eudoraea sp.]
MNYNLAQINIARMLAPLDSEIMKDFVNNLDRINQLAEKSEGFIWRLIDDNNESAVKVFNDDEIVVNMSVWTSIDALFNFTYKSDHKDIFKRRKEWFSAMKEMHMACWYVPVGKYPTAQEAKDRLDHLNKFGESSYAFTLKSNFMPEEAIEYKLETRKQK